MQRNEEGDGNVVVVAFFFLFWSSAAAQRNKEGEGSNATVAFFLQRKKQSKVLLINVVTITFFALFCFLF